MEYCKLFWRHELAEEPVVLLYEIDPEQERLAHRSMDVFADRRIKRIPDLYAGAIEILPIPKAEEFNSGAYGEAFSARLISAEEFEEFWRTGVYTGPLTAEAEEVEKRC